MRQNQEISRYIYPSRKRDFKLMFVTEEAAILHSVVNSFIFQILKHKLNSVLSIVICFLILLITNLKVYKNSWDFGSSSFNSFNPHQIKVYITTFCFIYTRAQYQSPEFSTQFHKLGSKPLEDKGLCLYLLCVYKVCHTAGPP